MVMSSRVVVVVAAAVVLAGAVWFRSGLHRAAVWERELAFVAEAGRGAADGSKLPHLEYQSPAFRAVLKGFGVGGADLLRARTVSWLTAVAATAALIAAGWTLFSPLEGVAMGIVAVGSPRLLQAAQLAAPEAFLVLCHALTAALFGLAIHTSAWAVWIALGGVGVIAALGGFQSIPLLVAMAAVGGALLSQRTRRDGTEAVPPVWQYLSCIPVAVAVGAVWSISWVLASRGANPPIAKPPLMNLRYLGFLHGYLLGHGGWGATVLAVAGVLGVVGSLRKRIVRIEDMRRIYVDKRSRRPMVFLLLWLFVGVPVINLLLFNARRPQDPASLNTLFVPLGLIAARGVVLGAEGVLHGLRRVAGIRAHMLPVVVVLALAVGWFGQASGRRAYAGYRMAVTAEDPWAAASAYLTPRAPLGRAVVVTPPWAGSLIKAHLGRGLSGMDVMIPTLGRQVDSLVHEVPASWSILYQSELFSHVPERVRDSIERNFEELKRFHAPWGGAVIMRATPWLHAAESEWSVQQERLELGGDDAEQAWLMLARLYADAGHADSAKAALQRVLAQEPSHPRALMEMAAVALREGDPEAAAGWFGQAAEADSTDPRPRYQLARLAMEAGDLETARASLERVLALDSRHVQAAQQLVGIYRTLGRTADAETMERRIGAMGGRVVLDHEHGRVLLVRSVELPSQTWSPGDAASIVVSWATLAKSSRGVVPVLTVRSETSGPMLRPPPGGWAFSLPDTGFAAGLSGTDTLLIHLVYRDLPRRYPDEIQVSLSLTFADGEPLAASTTQGTLLEEPVIARIVAWRAGGQRRVTVEAEAMDQHPGFPVPGGINVGDPGLVHSFRFPGGPVTFEVVARGTPAAGQWPRMIVEVGGQPVRELEVPDREWRTYVIPTSASPGLRAVRLRFPNDYINPSTGEDRNLVVDKITMVEEEIRVRIEAP